MKYKILLVDNEPADLDCTKIVLAEEADFEVFGCTDADEAISLLKAQPEAFSAILLDYRMPKKDGIATATEMFAINPQLCIAILSADQSRDVLKKCIAVGVKDFIEKDQDEEVLRSVVRGLCKKWEDRPQFAKQEATNSDDLIPGVIGQSPQMRELFRMVKRAAQVKASICIYGESGTGKEVIAKAIHRLSPRKNKPFIALNMSAIPENLAESELFGHVKGAFTGADRVNEGKLLAAQGGTLFLDEIGDMRPDLQAKLLRVLQERKVTPVGASKSIDLDVHLITATHVDLEKAILDGRFREDLYFRIHVLPIRIPPLRDRVEDIRHLVFHFLKIHGGETRQISTKILRYLESYTWRGNVRELENEIQRLVSLSDRIIEAHHLSEKIKKHCAVDLDDGSVLAYGEFFKTLQENELEYLRSNVRRCGSMREACRSVFKAPVSSIHTRIKILEQNFNSSIKEEKNHE